MADYYTTSDQSSVSGARVSLTESVSISAKPSITRISPTWVLSGYSDTITVEGYNFQHTEHLFLSAEGNVYTNQLSAITAFNPFGSGYPYLSGDDKVSPGFALSSLYVAFNGFEVKKEDYRIASPNALTFTLCATQNVGRINVIIVNKAGYSDTHDRLFMDGDPLSGFTRVITVSAPNEVLSTDFNDFV